MNTTRTQDQNKPSSEEYQEFRKVADEFEPLHKISEDHRTDAQRTAHGELLSELMLRFDNRWLNWDWKGLSPAEMNNAFAAHVAKSIRASR
jgi:hypothetical protein